MHYALTHSVKVNHFTVRCWSLLAMLAYRDDHQADVIIIHSLRIYEFNRSVSMLVIVAFLGCSA